LKITADEISDHIFKLARKGLTPSQIGVILRDSHGVAQVKSVTGNKILRILKTNGRFFSTARNAEDEMEGLQMDAG
jgi:small subunit ribosomal protein S13e